MAHQDRNAAYALILRLMEKPYAYDFFAAVRRIEVSKGTPARTGASHRLRDDPIRFGQDPSLAFAPSTVHALHAGRARRARSHVRSTSWACSARTARSPCT
jgi:predicted component of type VI protein secretion system